MPYVQVSTQTGCFEFCYSIATPLSHAATEIVPNIPSIIFIHSGYLAQEVFECQFDDPGLRQFNLIAIDMRGCGDTRGIIRDALFTPTESAEDIAKIMVKLNLPPCHIFGLSNGCTVALELAIAHPERVLSLILCSPVTPQELKEIASYRLEMFRLWDSIENPEPDSNDVSSESFDDLFNVATKLLFNHQTSSILDALCRIGMANAVRNWSGSKETLHQSFKVHIEWFLERRVIPKDMLAKLRGPVTVIYCSEDNAYPLENAENLTKKLEAAGVSDVSLHKTHGAHFGNVTNPKAYAPQCIDLIRRMMNAIFRINRVIYNTVVAYHSPESQTRKLPTPFTKTLEKFGYDPDDE
ncbi:Alpha/Beta hydrolase protein [Crassisporium funariophilum]|nr:Alpha/Beta hydrolase protein [Crassisporium funariophilum]